MSELSGDEKQRIHNGAWQDAQAGRSRFWNEPWRGPFESFENYDERKACYDLGFENALNRESDDERK